MTDAYVLEQQRQECDKYNDDLTRILDAIEMPPSERTLLGIAVKHKSREEMTGIIMRNHVNQYYANMLANMYSRLRNMSRQQCDFTPKKSNSEEYDDQFTEMMKVLENSFGEVSRVINEAYKLYQTDGKYIILIVNALNSIIQESNKEIKNTLRDGDVYNLPNSIEQLNKYLTYCKTTMTEDKKQMELIKEKMGKINVEYAKQDDIQYPSSTLLSQINVLQREVNVLFYHIQENYPMKTELTRQERLFPEKIDSTRMMQLNSKPIIIPNCYYLLLPPTEFNEILTTKYSLPNKNYVGTILSQTTVLNDIKNYCFVNALALDDIIYGPTKGKAKDLFTVTEYFEKSMIPKLELASMFIKRIKKKKMYYKIDDVIMFLEEFFKVPIVHDVNTFIAFVGQDIFDPSNNNFINQVIKLVINIDKNALTLLSAYRDNDHMNKMFEEMKVTYRKIPVTVAVLLPLFEAEVKVKYHYKYIDIFAMINYICSGVNTDIEKGTIENLIAPSVSKFLRTISKLDILHLAVLIDARNKDPAKFTSDVMKELITITENIPPEIWGVPYKKFISEFKKFVMSQKQIYPASNEIVNSMSGGGMNYYAKYMKYKMKYLKLKQHD